jgi:hypothetical protein
VCGARQAGRLSKGRRHQCVVKFINERLSSDTVRTEVLDNGSAVNKKRSPTTVNKEVTLLSSIFRMAIKEKLLQPIRVRNCQSPCGL